MKVAPEKLVKDEDRTQIKEEESLFGSKLTFEQVRKKMVKHRRDTVIFIHGYNVSFKEALTAAAKLKRNFRSHTDGRGINVFLFTWPSDGSMTPFLAYASDRKDALASGPAFARGFLKLADFLRGATPAEEIEDRTQIKEEESLFGSKLTFEQVRKKMVKHRRDTVIFIHGYNVSFKEALTAAAKLKRNFRSHTDGRGINVFLFTWPSDGSMTPFLAYASDRKDALASGPAFARGFLKLADFLRGATPAEECRERIHLVAHSMGNYVLRHAVQEIVSHSPGRPPRAFDQIFLLAADEDDDAFERTEAR